jgi:hypothetical protein
MCGFDQQMLEGLGVFHAGLARAITKRTGEGASFEDAVREELEELDAFISELQNLYNEVDREKLLGISSYARSFYHGALTHGLEQEDSRTRDFLYSLDRIYYERLEGRRESIPELIKILNNRGK